MGLPVNNIWHEKWLKYLRWSLWAGVSRMYSLKMETSKPIMFIQFDYKGIKQSWS